VTKSAAIVAVVNAALAALIAFGIDLTDAQVIAVTGFVNAALVLAAAWMDPKIPFGRVQ